MAATVDFRGGGIGADFRGTGNVSRKLRKPTSLDEAGVRGLRIPASSRAVLSPSKNAILPQLQEVASAKQLRPLRGGRGDADVFGDELKSLLAGRGTSLGGGCTTERTEPLGGAEDDAANEPPDSAQQVMPVLKKMQQDFEDNGGSLDLDQFTMALLQHLHDYEEVESSGSASDQQLRAAAAIDLFRRVDVHGEGAVLWEGLSSYLIEHGMAGGDDTIDVIKDYEPSPFLDPSKHEHAVEKLAYLQHLDSIVCLSRNSFHAFRLYDPKRLTLLREVKGHRGTVVNCGYVPTMEHLVTTSVDQTICTWDSSMRMRTRVTAPEVQLCLNYDHRSRSLFSGSISGLLNRWDLSGMLLADTKGGHKKEINDIIHIPDLDLIATASSDGYILMWDTELLRFTKSFRGHKKGVVSLAYSMDYHCMLTAGVDQEAYVWNPYVEKEPIFKLKGHSRTLCGVSVLPGTPQIVTADVSGTFRLWDTRNFRCIQSFGESSNREFNTFCSIPVHKKIVGGGSKLIMYDYMDDGGEENATDSANVVDALYNAHIGAFYTMSKRSVKFWSASTGRLAKVLRDVVPHEITAACLSDSGLKLYLGDSGGNITAHAMHNGKVLTRFDRHDFDISRLCISRGTAWLFSASWDGEVKFHTDEKMRPPVCHSKIKKHRAGVTTLACSPELMLLASGGNDMQVVLYDLRTYKCEQVLKRFDHLIEAIDFVAVRCLLAVADQGGNVSLWRVRPHPDQWAYVFHFKATPDISHGLPISVTALRFVVGVRSSASVWGRSRDALADPALVQKAPPLLYTADAAGHLRCWDLSRLCEKRGVVEDDLKELFERNRVLQLRLASSPQFRPFSSSIISRHGAATPAGLDLVPPGDAGDGGPSAFVTALVDEDEDVRMVAAVAGHNDAILQMNATDSPRALITIGQDRRVQVWSEALEARGQLLPHGDAHYRFGFDPVAVRNQRLVEAAALLRRLPAIGSVVARRKSILPAVMPRSASEGALVHKSTSGVDAFAQPPRSSLVASGSAVLGGNRRHKATVSFAR